MKLRTTMFLWVLGLVIVLLGATIGTIAFGFDRATRERLAQESARSREVTLDLHADRYSLYRQECRVVAEEPRLKAVVATEEIERATVLDAVRELAKTLDAGVFLIVDADGNLIADSAHPEEAGGSMREQAVVAASLEKGESTGVWVTENKVFQVAGCRLEFGARVVGALVVGHAIDDKFVDTVEKHTGGEVIVALEKAAVSKTPDDVGAAEVAAAIDAVEAGRREVSAGGQEWFAQVVAIPGTSEGTHAHYVLLRSIDEALAPARRAIRFLAILVGVALVLTAVLALGLARRLSRPIDALVARTQAIAHGDLTPRPTAGPTEVRALGAAMDKMTTELDTSRRALADKERLARELEIAARIQTSILPRNLDVEGLEIAAKMMTATEVGGDYYDVLPVEDGCWIAVGDASGHGLTAGLVMMMVQTGVATLVHAQPDANPKDVVRAINGVLYDNIHERLEAERHMTLSLLRYRRGGDLRIAGAHMDGIVWRAATKTIELLATPGTFLAITQDIDHVNQEATWQLHDGDLLVLLTDGVTEAENAAGASFDYQGVTRIVEERCGEPVAAIRDALFAALIRHSPALEDDATIMVLRYAAAGRNT
ncbi:MAG TPA: SpoIIE family protein phosphatase [Kofleriaceae bacterium]|nr:SpoIIE family protein phosphatase [Kofleriaceae bacterium]